MSRGDTGETMAEYRRGCAGLVRKRRAKELARPPSKHYDRLATNGLETAPRDVGCVINDVEGQERALGHINGFKTLLMRASQLFGALIRSSGENSRPPRPGSSTGGERTVPGNVLPPGLVVPPCYYCLLVIGLSRLKVSRSTALGLS